MSQFKKQLLVCLAFVLFWTAVGSEANDENARPFAGPKRWLLVVETSSPMAPRKQAVMASLAGMLESEMNGQLEPGDTIGVWTFNKQLAAGKLPLHTWLLAARKRSAMEILTFIEAQKFEHAPNPGVLSEPLTGVAANSQFLTVVLVTSGLGKISGTPFDEAINKAWASWDGKKSRKPIVTVLRARDGVYVQHRVTPGEFSPLFPALPKTPALTNAPRETAASSSKTVASSPALSPGTTSKVLAPLIFKGPNKPEVFPNAPPQTNLPIPGKPVVETTNVETTNLPAATITQQPPILVPPAPKPVETGRVVAPALAPSTGMTVQIPTQATNLQNTSAPPTMDTPAAVSAQTAETAPEVSPRGMPRSVLVAAGSVLILAVIAGAFLIVRRKRGNESESSLITESIDEDSRRK